MIIRLAALAGAGAAEFAVIGAGALDSTNAILNLFTIILVVVAAVPVISSRRKDAAIKDLQLSEERLEKQLSGAQERANEEHERRRACEREIAELRGRCETLERYSAPVAFEALASKLGSLEGTMSAGISNLAELVMENTSRQSQAVEALGAVGRDFGRLAERLGASGDRPPRPEDLKP